MLTSKFPKTVAALMLAGLTMTGCQTSHILVGQPRPAISPDQVVIYLHPPAQKYEEIALLDTSSKNSFAFTAQGKTDAVIARLKKEAASLGANGILLNGVGDQASGSVSSGIGGATSTGHAALGVGFGSSGTVYQKKGGGLAIYVDPGQVASR